MISCRIVNYDVIHWTNREWEIYCFKIERRCFVNCFYYKNNINFIIVFLQYFLSLYIFKWTKNLNAESITPYRFNISQVNSHMLKLILLKWVAGLTKTFSLYSYLYSIILLLYIACFFQQQQNKIKYKKTRRFWNIFHSIPVL